MLPIFLPPFALAMQSLFMAFSYGMRVETQIIKAYCAKRQQKSINPRSVAGVRLLVFHILRKLELKQNRRVNYAIHEEYQWQDELPSKKST